MDWTLALAFIFGGLLFFMLLGMPVAFCFLIVNIIGVSILKGPAGLGQIAGSIFANMSTFTLAAIPLFLLMGDVMFRTGTAPRMIAAMDNWIGRVPGRLSLVTVGSGTVLAFLTGQTSASVALLGTTMVPEMRKRGYSKSMTLGPILASGGLAMMIPPSTQAVVLGAIGGISIGSLLIGIVVPGLLMAVIYAIYVIIACKLKPAIAPEYDIPPIPLSKKIADTAREILPLGSLIFMVTGVILLGVATPEEAAALGCLGTFILALFYKNLNWKSLKASLTSTTRITVMVLFIMMTAQIYSQMLALSGATKGLIGMVAGLHMEPLAVFWVMVFVYLVLGMFMPGSAILMITLPVFVPIMTSLGFNLVWFGVVVLLTIEMSQITPPYGFSLFVLKGVSPPDISVWDCAVSCFPYLACDVLIIVLMCIFPGINLWLPSLMR